MSIPIYHDKVRSMEPSTCDCDECKAMCCRPCWPTPAEARRLIEAGYADRMMCDWWSNYPDDIEIICPAVKGSEGQRAPELEETVFAMFGNSPLHAGCTLLTDEGKCPLHEKGLKPTEARLASCDHTRDEASMLHESIASTWNSDEGRAVVKLWKEATGG